MTASCLGSRKQSLLAAATWIPISLGIILRSIQVWMPITGIHSWRQADTAAMARHFHLSETPIWLPQIDWGGASAGYVESEFPLFPYLTSQLYQVFGIHEWLGRCVSIFCSGLTSGSSFGLVDAGLIRQLDGGAEWPSLSLPWACITAGAFKQKR